MPYSVSRLTPTQVQKLLCTIPQWNFIAGGNHHSKLDTIRREYRFRSFEESWSFITRVAMRAHKLGHHPTIVNKYNIVELELTTHDVEGLSELDFKMAKALEKAALQLE